MTELSSPTPRWISCPECEAACREVPLPPRAVLHCRRCGVVVRKSTRPTSLQPAWALATAGLLLMVMANVTPIMSFDVAGNTQTNLIGTGVITLYKQGYWPVAGLVFFSAIAAPALYLATVWYVVAACCLARPWPGLHRMLTWAEILESWNLVPVFALATLVSVVKLDTLGTVTWHHGAIWLAVLSICAFLTSQLFDHRMVEERLEELA
jgi:paraquat-inducible protein A